MEKPLMCLKFKRYPTNVNYFPFLVTSNPDF